jgi:NitT/TauT family transport system substrate-binding protein
MSAPSVCAPSVCAPSVSTPSVSTGVTGRSRVLRRSRILGLAAVLAMLMCGWSATAHATEKFRIAWSIYVGWMPWGYMEDSGILEKWEKKYDVDIEVVQINDYIESINLYTSGEFDGCSMTNMDALTIPAAGGVDSTALIVGDFSNGNDAVVLKGTSELTRIAGRRLHLVELSVSHYLLARGLDSVGLSERDVTIVNVSDSDIVGIFGSDDVTAGTLWNPQLSEVLQMPDTHNVFDSSRIPGEIIDLMVVNSNRLAENPAFGKALVGAWYETMQVMSDPGERGRAARRAMATAAGADLESYERQLATTQMFYQPTAAVEFVRSTELPKTMDRVRSFSFRHGLLGPGAKTPDFVGIAFPGEEVLGDAANVKLRFDDTYQQMAADGEL